MQESELVDKKRLEVIIKKDPDWKGLAKDCVCFANARGGIISIGIADDADAPPPTQKIPIGLDTRLRKRMSELTVNVGTTVTVERAPNGGECIKLRVLPSNSTIASTIDGRYFYRIDQDCKPLMPDELSRLFTDKPSFIWETRRTVVSAEHAEPDKLATFVANIRASDRASSFVKAKEPPELLEHYLMVENGHLTNLGVL